MSTRRYLSAVGLLIAAGVLLWFLTPSTPGLDDAYIPLHAAHVVLEGHDAVYDVPALTGATSSPSLHFSPCSSQSASRISPPFMPAWS